MSRYALALLLSLAACSRGPSETTSTASSAVPVGVASVEQRAMPVELTAVGTVVASETVSVRPQVDGQISRVHFREGGDVGRGELLFTLDPSEFQARLRQAEANLQRDRATAENARREAARYTELLRQGFVSRSQAEQFQATAAAAAATVVADEAAVKNARVDLDRTQVRAPIAGRAGRVLVYAGGVVRANETELVVINRIRPIDVAFALPAQHLMAIQTARQARPLQVIARPEGTSPSTGELTFIDNRVDPQTGTIALKASFENAEARLWPGEFVTTTLVLGTQPNAIIVPAVAVQHGQQGPFVFVVRDGHTVDVRPVKVDRQVGDVTVVAEGLRPGETVVTEGQLRLSPGATVQISDTGNEAAASPGQ